MSVEVGTKVPNADKFLKLVDGLESGIQRNLTGKVSMTVGGASMSQAAILAKLVVAGGEGARRQEGEGEGSHG